MNENPTLEVVAETPPAVDTTKLRDLMIARMMSSEPGEVTIGFDKNDVPKKEATTPEGTQVEAPKADEPPKTETPAKADEPAPEPKKRRPAPRKEVDVKEIVEGTATATATAVTSALEKARKEEEERRKADEAAKVSNVENPELPQAYKKDEALYDALAKHKPGKYADVRKRIVSFDNELNSYRDKWEKDNPKAKFNISDPEHEEFLEAHEPDLDPEDIQEAREKLRDERTLRLAEAKAEEKYKPVLERLEREAAERKLQQIEASVIPVIERTQSAITKDVLAAVDPAIAAVFDDSTPEAFQKFEATHPEVAHVLKSSTQEIVGIRKAAAKLLRGGEMDWSNKDNVRVHELYKIAEAKRAKLPELHTLPDGRTWLPLSQFLALPPEQQSKHWFFDADQFDHQLVSHFRDATVDVINNERARIEQVLKARGVVAPASKVTDTNSQNPAVKTTVSAPPALPTGGNSPSVGGGGPSVGVEKVTLNKPMGPLERILASLQA